MYHMYSIFRRHICSIRNPYVANIPYHFVDRSPRRKQSRQWPTSMPFQSMRLQSAWVPNALELARAKAALANSFSELDALCYSVELAIELTQAPSNFVALPASASGKLLLWMTRLEDALEDCPGSSVLQSYLIKTRLAHERVMQLE